MTRFYRQGFAAYGSVRNLEKATKFSPSSVRAFLHSKTSYTRFTQARLKLKRMRAFARYKDENWCMDLAYVDKLAKDNNGVKYLLVRQDLFDRPVDGKNENERLGGNSKVIFKKLFPKRIVQKCWVDQAT